MLSIPRTTFNKVFFPKQNSYFSCSILAKNNSFTPKKCSIQMLPKPYPPAKPTTIAFILSPTTTNVHSLLLLGIIAFNSSKEKTNVMLLEEKPVLFMAIEPLIEVDWDFLDKYRLFLQIKY